MDDPLVAIVGRPNVGKSTLFNRLIGRRDAIVTDIAGTTRDRLIGDATWWDGSRFTVVDTGGLEFKPQDQMRAHIKAQVELAVDQAEIIIFLLDVADGITPIDWEIASWLRITKKHIITVINKVDNQKREFDSAEFYRLGIGEPMQISAYHNLGIHDLIESIISFLPPVENVQPSLDKGVIRLSITGRTNVGKSMLVNAILGQERSIVSNQPGTTRDTVDTPFQYEANPMVLVDTAGIRRRGKVGRGIEYFSVLRAVRAIQRSDVSLLVMDATELATSQDAHVSAHGWDGYKGLIVVINKWDLIDDHNNDSKELAIQTVRERLHFMPYVPILFTSALLKQGIDDLMSLVLDLYKERFKQVPEDTLRYAVMSAMADQMPQMKKGKRLKIYSVKQTGSNPPTFLFTVNEPSLVHFSYHRYLENKLRSTFSFIHTHLRLVFKVGRK